MITKDNIKYMYKSGSSLDGKGLRDFDGSVYSAFDLSICKNIVNKFFDGLGLRIKVKKRLL